MTKVFIKSLLFFILSLTFSSNLFAVCDPILRQEMADNIARAEFIKATYEAPCIADPLHRNGYKVKFGTSPYDAQRTYYDYRLWSCDGNTYMGSMLYFFVPNACMSPTPQPSSAATHNQKPQFRCGSIIQTSNMVVGETISLTGVPFSLSNFSNNTFGKKAEYKTIISLSSSITPFRLTGFTLIINDVQNNTVLSTPVAAAINQTYTYQWNGLENGVETWGSVKRNALIKSASDSTPIPDQNFSFAIGGLKSKKLGLGGWLPSNWHFYDSASTKLFDGDGSSRNVVAASEGIYNRVASSDGQEVYYFDSIGRLVFTKTGLTGALIYSFNYDPTTEKLLSIADAFNKVITFQYDSSNNLAQIISAENIHTYFTVDANGYLKTVTNPKNETYSMTYKDAGGLLASFTKPSGVSSTFNYDGDGNLLTDINSGGQSSTLSKTTNGVNAVSTLGRITQNNFDSATNTEIEIRPSGLATTYVHAPTLESTTSSVSTTKSNLVADLRFGNQVMNPAQVQSTNFGTTTTNIEDTVDLNDLTNPFSIATFTRSVTDGASELTSQYDGLTRTNTVTTKLGRSVATQLDSLERPILEQAGNTLPKKYTYQSDLLSKIVQGDREINLTYNASTKLLSSVKNSANQEVNFFYDDAQRLSSKRLPDGRVINYIYDSNNNLVSITPPGQSAHFLNYGTSEQLSSYVPPALAGVANVNTTYLYSKDKELLKITRPDGQAINLNYGTSSGLLLSLTGNFGAVAREYQNELLKKITNQYGKVATFGYIGNVVSSLETSDYKFTRSPSADTAGLVGSETVLAGNKNQTTSYVYDDDKMLSTAGDLNLVHNSPNGALVKTTLDNITETYSYDSFGDVSGFTSTVKIAGVDKALYSYTLTRDTLGRNTNKIENNNGSAISAIYTYDSAGRLINASGSNRPNVDYTYDSNSNRLTGFNFNSVIQGASTGITPMNGIPGGTIADPNTPIAPIIPDPTNPTDVAVYDSQDRLVRYKNHVYSYNANGDLLSKSVEIPDDIDPGTF
ncbi:MAG: hypothetical protein Q7U04_06965, partial [Bacteriovorax sp.]|nr:hypothetical protein [Bacteriovorax sp.]